MNFILSFKQITLEDRERFESCLKETNYRVTESSFVVLYIWRNKYGCDICIEDGFLYIRYTQDGESSYAFPMGNPTGQPADSPARIEELRRAIDKLERHCAEAGEDFSLGFMCDEMKDELDLAYPGRFEYEPFRDYADYLYTSESLISLAGKKLHSKRNFVNRFKAANEGRWSFEEITSGDLPAIYEYEKQWWRDNRTSEGDLAAENIAIKSLLDNMDALGAVGGMLKLDGKIIGFSVASGISEDTVDIHIEKAEWEIPGAYQTLNREFAERFCSGYKYINREDDMGLEGLRKAKLSYYPAEIKMKYGARPAEAARDNTQYLCVMERGYHELSNCKTGG